MFVAEEKKNGKGKGGKYFETENIFLQRRELKWRRKRKKIFGKGKYPFFGGEEKRRKEK